MKNILKTVGVTALIAFFAMVTVQSASAFSLKSFSTDSWNWSFQTEEDTEAEVTGGGDVEPTSPDDGSDDEPSSVDDLLNDFESNKDIYEEATKIEDGAEPIDTDECTSRYDLICIPEDQTGPAY